MSETDPHVLSATVHLTRELSFPSNNYWTFVINMIPIPTLKDIFRVMAPQAEFSRHRNSQSFIYIHCNVSRITLMGQSGQIGTVHQKPLTLWNITHMMIWNSLIEPFGVKYERTNLGQARFYINKESWPLFSGCHALTFCCFLRIWTRKIIKFLLFLVSYN